MSPIWDQCAFPLLLSIQNPSEEHRHGSVDPTSSKLSWANMCFLRSPLTAILARFVGISVILIGRTGTATKSYPGFTSDLPRCAFCQSNTNKPRSANAMKLSGDGIFATRSACVTTGNSSNLDSISDIGISFLRTLSGIGPTPAVMKAATCPRESTASHTQSTCSGYSCIKIPFIAGQS